MSTEFRESADKLSKEDRERFLQWLQEKFDMKLTLTMTTSLPGRSQNIQLALNKLDTEATCKYDSKKKVGDVLVWEKATECFRAMAHECEHLVRMREGTHEIHKPGSTAEYEYDFRIDAEAQRLVNEYAKKKIYDPDNPDLNPTDVEWISPE